MHRNFIAQWAARFLVALAVLILPQALAFAQQQPGAQQGDAQQPGAAQGQPAEAQRQVTQPGNNAPMWRDVRSGDVNAYQTTQVRGRETNVLIQNEGEMWRRVRNGPVTVFGGWLVVIAFLAILLFYWWRGEIMLQEPRTGREILRFTSWERILHWTTAIVFLILAVSGIFMLFGRYVLLPVFGYSIFSALTVLGKNLHNFLGPLFIVCTLLMVFTFIRDNFFHPVDWTWLRRFADFLKGRHVSAERFNAGEKIWFWLGVLALGVVVGVTGLVLDFPNFGQTREAMQLANVIHAVAAVGYISMSLGHIYLGTIGLEGSYDAMRHGTVDETWAKEHHDIWYREVMAGRAHPAPGGSPTTAPASPMKEGWKA